jgi:hypothetical protein
MRKGFIGAVLAIGLAVSGTALAQDPEAGEVAVSTTSVGGGGGGHVGSRGPTRVYGGIHLGGGGNVKVMPEEGDSDKADMAFLVGFQAGLDHVIHPYVALGGEFRFTSTQADDVPDDADRLLLVDFTFKPRGRYEFNNIPLEIYLTLPVGLSVVAPRNDADTKVNANFGVGPGATYFFNDKMGINTELLGIFHWYRETVESDFIDEDFTFRNRIGQFYWLTNFVYVL